jgi:manganese/iron transport system substrate-binding protein
MFRSGLVFLATWLTIITWVITACGPAQMPPTRERSPQPTLIVEHESEQGYQAEMAQLKPVSLGAGEKLRVVATTNIVADVVSQVGEEAIELSQLLTIGADPHTYIATPRDVAAVADAHVIFANGANLEAGFLPQLLQGTDAPVTYVSQGIEFREFGTQETYKNKNGEEEQHHGEGIDPHTWTTPANVVVFVHNIEHTLSALDPANAGTYQANAEAYAAELEALDGWVIAQIATIPAENRKLVTDHTVFGYYANRYGLEQIGALVPAFSTAAEPSAQELAGLEDAIREYGVKAVFTGTTINPSLARQLAEDTGAQLVTIYTGSLGPEGSSVETYIAYTCYNTAAIAKALGGTPDVVGSPCD